MFALLADTIRMATITLEAHQHTIVTMITIVLGI